MNYGLTRSEVLLTLIETAKMDIPFIDIHSHSRNDNSGVIAIQSYFLQDFNPSISALFTAAIHPWHVGKFQFEEVRAMLEKLDGHPQLIAIGETGLDRVCLSDYGNQKLIFELHIGFAERNNLPLVVHAVKSWNEMIGYLKKVRVPFIVHGYKSRKEITRQLVHIGGHFSIGKAILDPTPHFIEDIKSIPLTSIFLETDDSMVAIQEIYGEVSKIRGISLEDLKYQIYENYNKLFPTKEFGI